MYFDIQTFDGDDVRDKLQTDDENQAMQFIRDALDFGLRVVIEKKELITGGVMARDNPYVAVIDPIESN